MTMVKPMTGSILLISDIHSDICALEAILRTAESQAFSERYGPVEKIICPGDMLERGYNPGEVIDRLKSLQNVKCVLGNHDEAFLNAAEIVTGSDMASVQAHRDYKARGGYEEFFRGMGRYYLDTKNKLFVCHGGPIEPSAIMRGEQTELDRWLHSQTWQRITKIGVSYVDNTGYHYLPAEAFDAVIPYFRGESGYVIVCGHEHTEAAFIQCGDRIEDVLLCLECDSFEASGRKVEEKKLIINENSNYLVRLGIAGPAGYYKRYGWDRCYFGVMYEKNGVKELSMLSFQLGRDTVPPSL